MDEEESEVDISKKLLKDIDYIKNDIIAKHYTKKGDSNTINRYIKFSRALNAIAVLDLTREQYEKYWSTQYAHFPKIKEKILEIVDDKFKHGLTSKKEMLEILKNSKDVEKERLMALKFLGEKADIKEGK